MPLQVPLRNPPAPAPAGESGWLPRTAWGGGLLCLAVVGISWGPLAVLLLAVAGGAVLAAAAAAAGLAMRWCRRGLPGRPAVHPAGGVMHRRLLAHRRAWAWFRWLCTPLELCGGGAAILRCGGARVGFGAIIESTASCADPQLVELGDEVVVERGSRLQGWTQLGDRICLSRIQVSPQAIICGGCLLLPGAAVGVEAILCRDSVVPSGARIPAGAFHRQAGPSAAGPEPAAGRAMNL